jgi:hypothetical protein
MNKSVEVRELMRQLSPDPLRRSRPFDRSLDTVHRVLWSSFPTINEQQNALRNWLQKHQPCLFGRIAAAQDTLHLCILDEPDLYGPDEEISTKIRRAVSDWKRRSLSPNPEHSHPAHGFLLLIAARRVAEAAPDSVLRSLAHRIRELWGCVCEPHPVSGDLYWETLYIRVPSTGQFLRFTFSVDFFAAQGDGRWWKDHRIPGGIAFTANSIGHMKRYREFYEKMPEQSEWTLRTAMNTIAEAQETPQGKATWLIPRTQAGTQAPGVPCPSSHADFQSGRLANADWTKYKGYLHTDHSVRAEFFHVGEELPDGFNGNPYLLDFTYLYDPRGKDHIRFVSGEVISEEEVYADLGHPEEWNRLVSSRRDRWPTLADEPIPEQVVISEEDDNDIDWRDAYAETQTWALTPDDLSGLT